MDPANPRSDRSIGRADTTRAWFIGRYRTVTAPVSAACLPRCSGCSIDHVREISLDRRQAIDPVTAETALGTEGEVVGVDVRSRRRVDPGAAGVPIRSHGPADRYGGGEPARRDVGVAAPHDDG
jgi:hypothetical protein